MVSNIYFFNEFKLARILSIFGFIAILLSLFTIISNFSESVYAFSLYEAYPWYFWFLIIVSIFIGQLILLSSAFFEGINRSWIYGFIIIVLSNSILLFMPFIRGYFLHGRYDAATHIGYIIDIETMHHIGSNPYPMVHVFSFILASISSIDYNNVTMLVPPLFSLFWIISWYLLGNLMFDKSQAKYIMLSLSSLLLLGSKNVMLSPNGEALLFVPFFIYVFLKTKLSKNTLNYRVLLIIITFFIVYSHPLVAFLIMCTLVVADIPAYLNKTTTTVHKSIYNALIITCVFFSWTAYVRLFGRNLKEIIDNFILHDATNSELNNYASSITSANSADFPLSYIIEAFLKIYGSYVLLGILSLMCVMIVIIFWRKNCININYYHKFSIYGWLFFSSMSLFFLLFFDQFGFLRIYKYSMVFSFILIPFSVDMILKRKKKSTNISSKLLFISSIVLMLIVYLSVFNLYFSPHILKIDQQLSESEYSGMELFYSVKNNTQPVIELGIPNYRVHAAIYGASEPKKQHIPYTNPVIDHFGYINNSSSITDSYNETSYFLISDVGLYQFQKIFPQAKSKWNFVSKDIMQLNNDNKAVKVYSNEFLDIYVANLE